MGGRGVVEKIHLWYSRSVVREVKDRLNTKLDGGGTFPNLLCLT